MNKTKPDSRREKPRYFEKPDADVKPHTPFEIFRIIFFTHLGVRTSEQRQQDFRRANGLHLFIAGVLYFALIIAGLVLLVRHIAA